jgi:hypothetical protein
VNPQDKIRCNRCGDVIGAYEPLVALVAGKPRTANRRAVIGGELDARECYHHACFVAPPADPGAT